MMRRKTYIAVIALLLTAATTAVASPPCLQGTGGNLHADSVIIRRNVTFRGFTAIPRALLDSIDSGTLSDSCGAALDIVRDSIITANTGGTVSFVNTRDTMTVNGYNTYIDTMTVSYGAATVGWNADSLPVGEGRSRQWYAGISTNLLYDALLVPNIGVELWLGRNWSVKGDYMNAWWSRNSRHRYWRIEGMTLEGRYWFGKGHTRRLNLKHQTPTSPFHGHHAGIYAGLLTYDLEFGGRGWQGRRWSYNFGVSYGYAAAIGRRLSLDFNIGVGYFGGKYYEYEPGHITSTRYWWTATKQRHYIGPTRAEISLVWLIGTGNVHKSKKTKK